MFGSVSGGCVEADVAEHAKAVIAGADPAVVSYGIADERGLERRAAVRRRDRRLRRAVRRLARRSSGARATSSSTAKASASAGRTTPPRAPGSSRRTAAPSSPKRCAPPLRLVAVGAGDIAEALCALAKPLGWHTVVVDPRAGLATRERVPSADELVVA